MIFVRCIMGLSNSSRFVEDTMVKGGADSVELHTDSEGPRDVKRHSPLLASKRRRDLIQPNIHLQPPFERTQTAVSRAYCEMRPQEYYWGLLSKVKEGKVDAS